MTTSPTTGTSTTSAVPAQGFGLAQLVTRAYHADEEAQRRRVEADADADLQALDGKLAELGITPCIAPWITPNGEVRSTLIDTKRIGAGRPVIPYDPRPPLAGPAGLAEGADEGEVLEDGEGFGPEAQQVIAVASGGRIRLQVIADHQLTDAGELHTLADVGRALWEGADPAAEPDHRDLADQQITYRTQPRRRDTEAVCDALTALTYAVLAVADQLRDNTADMRDTLTHTLGDPLNQIATATTSGGGGPHGGRAGSAWPTDRWTGGR